LATLLFLITATLFSSITADQVREIDVIFGVKRDLVTYRLSTIYDYATTSTSATLRSYHLRGEVRRGEEKDGKQYWGEMGKASAWLRPHLDFSLFPTVAYGKLSKTRRFRDGVLYGGGANSFFNGSYFFNSYLAPYTDIFGNEILTSQIKTEWVLSRPFWGSGFVPLNIRAVSLVTGAEYIATDYLIADQRLYADQEFFGAIGGFKLDTILFYWLPVGLELVYSKILDNDIDQDWVGQLLLTTNLSF
jgi:hypothetical protein